MRILLTGIAGAIVLGVIAAFVLSTAQDPAYQVYSSSSTRVGDPGSNLIGRAWRDTREGESASGSAGAGDGGTRTAY